MKSQLVGVVCKVSFVILVHRQVIGKRSRQHGSEEHGREGAVRCQVCKACQLKGILIQPYLCLLQVREQWLVVQTNKRHVLQSRSPHFVPAEYVSAGIYQTFCYRRVRTQVQRPEPFHVNALLCVRVW